MEYLPVYFHFKIQAYSISLNIFTFRQNQLTIHIVSIFKNDLISPPNQKKLYYNYKALKTGNVVKLWHSMLKHWSTDTLKLYVGSTDTVKFS